MCLEGATTIASRENIWKLNRKEGKLRRRVETDEEKEESPKKEEDGVRVQR